MASFAKIENNIVIAVHSVVNEVLKDSNNIEQESIGIQFLKTLYNEPNAIWKQTSYNTHGGVHSLGGTPFRKNHAGIGYTYDETRDAFIPPKPWNSWVLDENTCTWKAPFSFPVTYTQNLTYTDGNPCPDIYEWNENIENWELTTVTISLSNNT
jgi:hypothetical protein